MYKTLFAGVVSLFVDPDFLSVLRFWKQKQPNESDFDDAVQYFDSQTPGYDGDDVRDEKYHFHYENDNVKAYKHIETGVVIELCCKIFGKPEEILNKFDFTITKFAYYKEEVEDETGAVVKRQELPFETLEDEHFLEEIGIPDDRPLSDKPYKDRFSVSYSAFWAF